MNDPLFTDIPDETGTLSLAASDASSSANLDYSLRGDPASHTKVIMLTGMFATTAHVASYARFLARHGAHVLTFDHRGIGRSTIPIADAKRDQDPVVLARDALQLMDHVFGPDSAVHIVGRSMGGMVAQRMAVELVSSNHSDRIASLVLIATTQSTTLFRPLVPWIPHFMFRFVLKLLFGGDRVSVMAGAVNRAFSREHLDHLHPVKGVSNRELWVGRWVREWGDWWTFDDMDVCATQFRVSLLHHLSAVEAQSLVESGIPIAV
ncbi:Alpha/Beta hydrolase protein, partial [Chytriomyces sp. MP71]